MKNTVEALDILQMEKLKKNLSKENIKKLFNELCKHKKEYNGAYSGFPVDNGEFDWSKCKECVLCKIDHYVLHGFVENGVIKRDICFAIWHDHEIDDLSRKKKQKIKKKKKKKTKKLQPWHGRNAEDSFRQDVENRKALARISVELQDNQR